MEKNWLKLIVIFILAIVLLGFSILMFNIYQLFYRPMPIEKNASAIIHLDKSTSAYSLVKTLKEKKLIQSDRVFLILIRCQGLSQQLKAGFYQIRPGESAQQFLYRVVLGDVLIESFRIIEGTTQAQVSANLARAPYLTYEPSDWKLVSPQVTTAEGMLLADTYHYEAGSQSKAILVRAHANLEQFLEYSWQQRSPNLPYKNAYQLLIAASIIEKEAALPRERRLIAGIIVNRLKKYMPLQMDPTVVYGLGSNFKGELTRENLRKDSPYNSYLYRGLPPTPIAMVGKDAIDAAAHPEFTNYLYFVARGDGSHYFSETYEQQKQAVARYRRNKK